MGFFLIYRTNKRGIMDCEMVPEKEDAISLVAKRNIHLPESASRWRYIDLTRLVEVIAENEKLNGETKNAVIYYLDEMGLDALNMEPETLGFIIDRVRELHQERHVPYRDAVITAINEDH